MTLKATDDAGVLLRRRWSATDDRRKWKLTVFVSRR
jgi:hypothetical protein